MCHQKPNPARETVPLNTSHSSVVQVYISGKEDVQTEGDLEEKCSLYFQSLTVEMGLYFQTLTFEMYGVCSLLRSFRTYKLDPLGTALHFVPTVHTVFVNVHC